MKKSEVKNGGVYYTALHDAPITSCKLKLQAGGGYRDDRQPDCYVHSIILLAIFIH